tara:strand:+ start:3241 stop:3615 length:375 start_codon:yes stop_codon:yes gene_type:complete
MKSKNTKKENEVDSPCKTEGKQQQSPFKTKDTYEHGKHPNSIANLKPYKKGESGNPGGRPQKYRELARALSKWKNVELGYDYWDMPPDSCTTLKDQVHWRIWQKATHGDNKCIEILARLGCLDD